MSIICIEWKWKDFKGKAKLKRSTVEETGLYDRATANTQIMDMF